MKVKKSFNSWASKNVSGRVCIESISFDTAGTPGDYLLRSLTFASLCDSATREDIVKGITGICVHYGCDIKNYIQYDCMDSVGFNEVVSVAKLKVTKQDDTCFYYIGLRSNNVYTTPKQSIYEALSEVHTPYEQSIYDGFYSSKLWVGWSESNQNIINQEGLALNRMDSKVVFFVFWKMGPRYYRTVR